MNWDRWVFRAAIGAIVGWMLFWLTVVSLLAWVVIHFIVKFW